MDEKIKEKIDNFFKQYKHQTYKKGEILIRADEEPSGIFYLTEGIVRQYFISRNGEECVVNIFKPISFFSMSWAINNTDNIYYFEAVSPVEVWKAPKEAVLIFIQQEPGVLYDLLARVYRGTDGLLTRLFYMMSGSAYTRLVAELILQVKRFGKKENDNILLHMSEKDLASQLGMTRETVSREMHILRKKGLISFSHNMFRILDLLALEGELSEEL